MTVGGKPLTFAEAHAPGLCSVAYLPATGGGAPTLVTAGPDGRLCFRAADAPGGEPTKVVENTSNGAAAAVHCVAAAAGRPVATGDEQNFVKVCCCCGWGADGAAWLCRHGWLWLLHCWYGCCNDSCLAAS